MKRNRFAEIMGVTPGERTEVDDETIEEGDKTIFFSQEVSRKAVQDSLNDLDASDRMTTLTSHRKGEVFNQLEECSLSGDTDRGRALYEEYMECLDDDYEEDYEDWHEASWVSSIWLSKMMNRKRVVNEWRHKK